MTRQLHETGFLIREIIELSDVDKAPWPPPFLGFYSSRKKDSLTHPPADMM